MGVVVAGVGHTCIELATRRAGACGDVALANV
jgi:hypothetical protein